MPYILALTQRKGGAGKTTLAVNLAGELAFRGASVALVDADPQESATVWASAGRLPFPVLTASIPQLGLKPWIRKIWSVQADFVVVDTPPGGDRTFGAAAAIADVAVVPCGPSGLDLEATAATVSSLRRINDHLARSARVVLVPVRVDRRTAEGRLLENELALFGFPVAPALGDRAAFVRAFTVGETVATSSPGSPSDEELQAVTDSIVGQLGREHLIRAA